MTNDEIEVLNDIEKEKKSEEEFHRKQQLNKEFEEASQGESFKLFNTGVAMATALTSLAICGYFLWQTNVYLFTVILVLILLSIVFRQAAKHYYSKGSRKKFETFNRLSKVTGVATSVCDSTVLKGKKGAGSADKVDDAGSAVGNAVSTIAELQYKGGIYTDKKYDDIRTRCVGMGKYIYQTNMEDGIHNMLANITSKRLSAKMTRDASVKTAVFVMYVRDILSCSYADENKSLFYAALGALHYFEYPLKDLPDSVPFVGYTDNVFCILCVYAGYKESIDAYKNWKLQTEKDTLVQKTLKQEDTIWNLFVSKSSEVELPMNQLLKEANTRIKELEIPDDLRSDALSLRDILFYYSRHKFLEMSEEQVAGMTGFLGYILLGDKFISGELTHLGYVDIPVAIKCCTDNCKETLDKYRQWKTLYNLYAENDILVEYLNAVIGNNPEEREVEVKRLAKQCKDSTLKDDRDRARDVVYKTFKKSQLNDVPKDLHAWAQQKSMSDEEALQRIYDYIPDANKHTEQDHKQQAIAYWCQYKHIFY